MRTRSRLGTAVTLVALVVVSLGLAASADAAVILGDAFEDVGDAQKVDNTATFGSWDTVNGITAPASSLSFFDNATDAALTFFKKQDGELDVNENIGSGGTWRTSFVLDLDASVAAIDLTMLDLTVTLTNGQGDLQTSTTSKDGIYTVQIQGSVSGDLGSASSPRTAYTSIQNQPISIDLSSFASLDDTETYTVTLSVTRGSMTWGHHISLDDMELSGDITPTPEPASLAILGLGGLVALRRRRRA